MTELEGRFRVDPMHPAMYHVMNHGWTAASATIRAT